MPNLPFDVAFGLEALRNTVHSNPGAGDDSDQPDSIRFVRAVAQILRQRSLTVGAPSPDITIFVLQPTVPPGADPSAFTRQPMLHNKNTSVEGQLWLVGPVAAHGLWTSLAGLSEDEAFSHIENDLKIGDRPAVVYDSRSLPFMFRYYYNGIGALDEYSEWSASHTRITMNEVFEVIDLVHRSELVVPNAQSAPLKLWKDRGKYIPSDSAEVKIQASLRSALSGRFPTCSILVEQPNTAGRLDLEIEEPDATRPGHFIRHVLIELKVLRSYTIGGNSISLATRNKVVSEGLDQAIAYRTARRTLAAALCCFDMQKEHSGDKCFTHVKAKAATQGIDLRVWPIFAELKKFRTRTTV